MRVAKADTRLIDLSLSLWWLFLLYAFRDGGATWVEPHAGPGGELLNVSNNLFSEKVGSSIKLGAPHVRSMLSHVLSKPRN